MSVDCGLMVIPYKLLLVKAIKVNEEYHSISTMDKLIYCWLLTEGKSNREISISLEALGDLFGLNVQATRRCVRKLEKLKLISSHSVAGKSNTYKVNDSSLTYLYDNAVEEIPDNCKEGYILRRKNENIIKFGISQDHVLRLKRRRDLENWELLRFYRFKDAVSCREAERMIKSSMECGVISKDLMYDGRTETTHLANLEKVMTIFEKFGGRDETLFSVCY